MLNEIFSELVEAVNVRDGVLDKFLGRRGDGRLRRAAAGRARRAERVESAVMMMELLEDLNKRRRRRGREHLRLGSAWRPATWWPAPSGR
jgi:hypothetical protein